jgi:hypothetical protein
MPHAQSSPAKQANTSSTPSSVRKVFLPSASSHLLQETPAGDSAGDASDCDEEEADDIEEQFEGESESDFSEPEGDEDEADEDTTDTK